MTHRTPSLRLRSTLAIVCGMAFALTACGGSVRVRPVSSWSISSEGAAQAGWFTLTRGAQTVILYCEYDEHSMDEGLRCAAHAVSLSGKADIRLQSEPIPDN